MKEAGAVTAHCLLVREQRSRAARLGVEKRGIRALSVTSGEQAII